MLTRRDRDGSSQSGSVSIPPPSRRSSRRFNFNLNRARCAEFNPNLATLRGVRQPICGWRDATEERQPRAPCSGQAGSARSSGRSRLQCDRRSAPCRPQREGLVHRRSHGRGPPLVPPSRCIQKGYRGAFSFESVEDRQSQRSVLGPPRGRTGPRSRGRRWPPPFRT